MLQISNYAANYLCDGHGLTRSQVDEIWEKSIQYYALLIRLNNGNISREVCLKLQEYQRGLIKRYQRG